MIRVDPLLGQSLQLLVAGMQIIRFDKIVNFLPLVVLDRNRVTVAGVKVFALLFGDLGGHA